MDFIFLNTADYVLAQNLFLKIVGFSYFLAFWSLFKQVLGLYGARGIIPIQETLNVIRENRSIRPYMQVPTLFWFDASDRSLRLLAGFGMAGSCMVMLGIASPLFLLLLWVSYLSFVTLGMEFLSFQWDTLLLEVGFISFFFSLQSPPPLFLLLSLWVLLFRFMFASGAVKLLSGCPSWRSCSAMKVHYETQPIPNRLAYFVHHQPEWVGRASVIVTFFIEMAIPFLIFGTDGMRVAAFWILVVLQVTIFLTGNYAFFNILSVALCIPLLPNSSLSWLMEMTLPLEPHGVLSFLLEGIGIVLFVLNILEFIALFERTRWVSRFLSKLSHYYIVNSYGLFAWMTTTRDEIVVDGSVDGETWKTYEFKWKPGDLSVAPKQVAPYHPRLDWQMWFAALGTYRSNYWFIDFLKRLLEGSPEVIRLLKNNPFPQRPPKFIRSLLYQYHFSDPETRRKTGQWWTRTYKGYYTPPFTLQKTDDIK